MDRYSRNISSLSVEENECLKNYKVCVVGCGGLGGYVIEMLGRLGIGHITAIDGDCFDESNLNRQLLSDMESIGVKKALRAKERMGKVNPLIEVQAVTEKLTELNGSEMLKGADVVVDALDSIATRLMLENLCEELDIPMVHGAIGGWYGEVITILPGDGTLRHLYSGKAEKGIEKKLGNPSFTPALVASIEVSEVVKLLIKRGQVLSKKMLVIDLLEQEYETITL
ncbi:MAG: HesA/MoeB/ThiF family protein [Bacillota bacterium]|nr:HesA/MoeB/ThiF family protein [Bacillota bacterium]